MSALQRFAVRIAACGLLVLLGVLAACSENGQRRELRGATMGTSWSLVYAARDSLSADTLRETIEADLLALNQSLSTYIPDSEISLLNAATVATPTTVSPMFAEVFDAALFVGRETEGAYDVTVGPLVELWGFGSSHMQDRVPTPAAIDHARSLAGAAQLQWDRTARQLGKAAGVRIDLSSIAKGYAVDRLAVLLNALGLRDFLVEIGGEVRAVGERPGGGPWRLAIESPRPGASRVLEALALRDVSVATSGDYRNFFEVDGQRYSHLVDPRSGYPVSHDLVSVTVVHESCMLADAWATALIVLGREAAWVLASEQGLAVYFVASEGDQLTVEYNDAFSNYLGYKSQ